MTQNGENVTIVETLSKGWGGPSPRGLPILGKQQELLLGRAGCCQECLHATLKGHAKTLKCSQSQHEAVVWKDPGSGCSLILESLSERRQLEPPVRTEKLAAACFRSLTYCINNGAHHCHHPNSEYHFGTLSSLLGLGLTCPSTGQLNKPWPQAMKTIGRELSPAH